MMRLILLLHMDRKTGYVGIAGMIQPVETIKIIIGQRHTRRSAYNKLDLVHSHSSSLDQLQSIFYSWSTL
jgi:hypothetical protein